MSRTASFDGPRIVVRGARTHNLKDVDLDLPRERLVVITGPSGSGKSSLAFDTIFAEGQRRYVESLSVAARQHLAQLPKPDVDLLEGLSPALAIAQEPLLRNLRATVGTTTEIYEYLKLLFARVGAVFHPTTHQPLRRHSITDMVEAILGLPDGARFSILAPVVRDRPGDHADLLDAVRQRGFVRAEVDGRPVDLGDPIALDPTQRHTLAVVVDRLKMKPGLRARIADSVETAARLADGQVELAPEEGPRQSFSERFVDPLLGASFPELTPALFSFNSPQGACPRCDGLGAIEQFDPQRIVPDPRAPMPQAVVPWQGGAGAALRKHWPKLARHFGLDPATAWADLPDEAKLVVLEGSGAQVLPGMRKPFLGIRPWLAERLAQATAADEAADDDDDDDERHLAERRDLEALRGEVLCPDCAGTRLRPEARRVKVGGKSLPELAAMPLDQLAAFFEHLALPGEHGEVATVVLEQVRRRLRFLCDVGLAYLQLDRPAGSLSAGEAQRIRLATQLGAALVGVTYILDEPSVGLHQRDNARLLSVLTRLRDLGNTVLVVEHDPDAMLAADWLVDMGPHAGPQGGQVIAAGPPGFVATVPESSTGAYLAGRRPDLDRVPRPPATRFLGLEGATGHNLQRIDVRIPLGRLTCVTGVSGSGKSTLVIDTLLPEAAHRLQRASARGLPHARIHGLDALDKVIHVDQSPIGRSPRSTPATYTGIFTELRTLFAGLPEARLRGYTPARFSFNVKGGRCEACQGEGTRRIEMHFLPDLHVTCQTCGGRRYNRETLEIQLKGKSIADVLDLCIADAYDFFVATPSLRAKLEVLRDVGLGYLTLGQRARTLSGGEAQRIKLARELARKTTGNTLFVLDEPTTGLHFGDVAQLVRVLQRLVDEGNTVVVIEHDLDVVAAADHVIDLGPEGGQGGGRIVAEGPPEAIAAVEGSYTGQALAGRKAGVG